MKKREESQDMSLEEAKAYRASLYREPVKTVTQEEKRELFRLFWAQEKKSYGKKKDLESILWMHLMESGFAEPEKFKDGLSHFGLKKIK